MQMKIKDFSTQLLQSGFALGPSQFLLYKKNYLLWKGQSQYLLQ